MAIGARQPAPAYPWPVLISARWKKKKRRKKEKLEPTAEQIATKGNAPVRLEDRILHPESPYLIAKNIGKHIARLTTNEKTIIRRKKDFGRYTRHRVHRLLGLTHDDAPDRGAEYTTPLTELQHTASLPRSTTDARFPFAHSLQYRAYWGAASVYQNPNKYEGSMVDVHMQVKLSSLPLTHRERERCVEIVGEDRYDENTGVVSLECETFPERNQNAAALGDMFEQLLSQLKR